MDKRYGCQMAGIRTIFLHSTKVFTQGYDIASTHYADWDKDYPLFCGIYQPDEAKQAELDAAQRRKKLKIDRRKTADFIRWLQSEVTAGHTPQVVELTGHHLNRQLRHQLEQELQLPWVGVSGQQRVYTLAGARKSRKATTPGPCRGGSGAAPAGPPVDRIDRPGLPAGVSGARHVLAGARAAGRG
ncbi:MAG: hypothetical protein KKA73_26905 [Chloroflexi bacterium]|nr:hypothetical protein [Chloroflexota bacterium]MBU1751330.1 hypothetical protein [Chloroflexota bacterium]